MSADQLMIVGVVIGAVVVGLGILALLARFYRLVDQGRALIVSGLNRSEPIVTFTGTTVLPIINRAEIMDISVKTIEIDRRGKEGLICADNIRADIKVTFFVRVNKTVEDVLKVAQSIGAARASDQKIIEHLFTAKFSEALKTVGKQLEFEDLYKKRETFRDQIKEVIGRDLNGFVLDDVAIDYLEQTPLELMDAQNILDAQGIKKITDITTVQNVFTNELRQKERMDIGSQNLKSDEAMFAFNQRRAEAEARTQKETVATQAREQNEAQRISDEEAKKTQVLRARFEEEILVAQQNKERGAAIAQKGREREIAVEQERVEKARQLEQIVREREVTLGTIAKEKEVEIQRKDIADVVRGRVAVEKTVAEEEERIKDLRLVAEAKRQKEAVVITASASAEEQAVKLVKKAEADEAVARHEAKKRLTIADADLETADKHARAKMRVAEGIQAEHAAAGLAEVRVREAQAAAIEKQGMAEALVIEKKLMAEATGLENKGMAEAKVLEKRGEAQGKAGLAEAAVLRERTTIEITGEEQKGLALARVREAEALAIAKRGEAEADAIQRKLQAEAAGLAEKAAAMKALDGVGREHEEFRLRLDKEKAVELAAIEVKKEIAKSQAEVMATAMGNAKIQIVGGDGQFFERFASALTMGQAIDATVDNSQTIQTVLADYLQKQRSLPEDLTEILKSPKLDSEAMKNLSVSAFLAKLSAESGDASTKSRLEALLTQAKKLGL
jgi:uncharacterized membrane protein YqiK